MEKFFIVTNESSLNKAYFDWKENLSVVNKIVKQFCQENNIESTGYYAREDMFYIAPTKKDNENFNKFFLKQEFSDGLRAFKKNSVIGKAWKQLIKNKGIKIHEKPCCIFYFDNLYGHYSERLFDIHGIVYLHINSQIDIDNPKGMMEIKASEFYKVIEAYEEEVKKQLI